MSSLLHRFEAGLNLLGRRSEPRYPASGFVQVYDGGPKGALLETASLRNLSASGACIAMMEPLAPGHQVHLAGPGLGVNAVVRHAGVGCSGYIIGLEFIPATNSAEKEPTGLPATW